MHHRVMYLLPIVCLSLKKESCWIQEREGAGDFIDKRLWSSTEFAVAVTAWLAHRSVHRGKDCRQATCPRSLLSLSDRTVASPRL